MYNQAMEMKHRGHSGVLVFKQLAVLSIVVLELSIYVASVGGAGDLASTYVTEVTV